MRLLRVVQDGEVVRVGGERPVHVDVRIVAATHPRSARHGRSADVPRRPLLPPLGLPHHVIPPLRDRPNDIRAFADYFAERAANRFGVRPVPVSDEDVGILAEYRWPGNVREMAAVMDRAVLIGQGRTLSVAAALGPGARTKLLQPRRSSEPAIDAPGSRAIEPLDVIIRRHIEAALGRNTRPGRRPATARPGCSASIPTHCAPG